MRALITSVVIGSHELESFRGFVDVVMTPVLSRQKSHHRRTDAPSDEVEPHEDRKLTAAQWVERL